MTELAATLGELRASGWVSRPVKEEIRANAVAKISAGEALFDGVVGYENTVMPQLENALLAGHDVIFLGERGQAKTRMIRSLTGLLDEWMPIVAASEINDDPYAPVSKHARDLIEEMDHCADRILDASDHEGGERQHHQAVRDRDLLVALSAAAELAEELIQAMRTSVENVAVGESAV